MLKNKKILIAITGGIAAYKAAYLVRHFIKSGAEVKVILTPQALTFVTPLTLATLSKNPVEFEFTKEKGEWNNHVEYGLWADVMIIAPATARTISSMADGHCDNLVLATYLSAKCPVFVAPAMDLDMYIHPSTTSNLKKLESFGNFIIPVGEGELASGLSGKGRMAEPEDIFSFIKNHFQQQLPLNGKKFLISAGPTYEPIDPVRFIGNHSSGKMGFAIAEEAANLGALVTVVAGPVHLNLAHENICRIDVETALQMQEQINNHYHSTDVVIMTAAVADYRPKEVALQKIKKKDENISIELIKNPDILKTLGQKKTNQILVGFALETNDAETYALRKLQEKNLDFIVLNSLQNKGAGFKHDTNQITIIDKNKRKIPFQLKSKKDVAKDILTFTLSFIKENV